MGARPIGKQAMSDAERSQRYRDRKRRAQIWGDNRDPAARRPSPRRADMDFWPTPPCLTSALVEHVLPILPSGPVWECAAGMGHLVDALRAARGAT
jgi:hypothetical protein